MKIPGYLFLLLFAANVTAQELVFEGFPSKRVQSSFDNRATTALTVEETRELKVTITRSGDQYFWASRDNTPLIRSESGLFVTYIAVDGSGYIRTLNPTARKTFIEAPPNNEIGQISYAEHLLQGLDTITYYGR